MRPRTRRRWLRGIFRLAGEALGIWSPPRAARARASPNDRHGYGLTRQRSDYLALRRSFEPESIRLAIIAESPPASGKYFYDPTGALSEPLFAALMKQLGFTPTTKESGLREFQQRGWVLSYEPVNALSGAARDEIIVRDYPLLHDDLAKLLPDRSTPLVLVKRNVCELLEPKLTDDGFKVLNKGSFISFPSHGQQTKFHRQFSAILESTEILTDGNGAPQPRRKKPRHKTAQNDGSEGEEAIRSSSFLRDTVLPVVKWVGIEFLEALQKDLAERSRTAGQARSGMADMGQGTLHEAIEEVLLEEDCRSAFEIADVINSRGLYTQRDGGPVSPSQISARANNYPHLFVRHDDKICLA
jgi:hypothetical protein